MPTPHYVQVGHRVMQQVGSGKDKRMEWHIHWQAAHAEYAAQRYYPAEDPDMQVGGWASRPRRRQHHQTRTRHTAHGTRPSFKAFFKH